MVTMNINNPKHFSKAHVTILNLNNFEMIEVVGLKLFHRGPLEWHYFPKKFMNIYQAVQKLLVGDTQTDV
jgi:hypothetical protein